MVYLDSRIAALTERIRHRSRASRAAYLARIDRKRAYPARRVLGCANLAHGFAACLADEKHRLAGTETPNLAIVTAYNDMLSAHKPYESYPDRIRAMARELGATAQVAGATPAMCDGITQGAEGMQLSLFSRDVIALSTAIALSHQTFDAAVYLGICDKIVPGLLIGALSFGHLPSLFIPSGPMATGLPNGEKARVRKLFAEGKADRADLLEVEARAYHGRGTCTFYGTANTNQMLLEFMGLQLPGSSFVPPDTLLRDALTRDAVKRVIAQTGHKQDALGIGHVVDERAIVNALVGLCATGGSTNAVLHMTAVAAASGIVVELEDYEAAAAATPLLAKVYPNSSADVNQFHAAGGVNFVLRQLLDAGLVHGDAPNAFGSTLEKSVADPQLGEDCELAWAAVYCESPDRDILRPVNDPFQASGGIRRLSGNLGRAVIKTSSLDPSRRVITAPARVFHSQEDLHMAFTRGELNQDVVVVVRFQGPKAVGMPELHKLTPPLAVLQDRGFKVALVTDGRMSGASGNVPAAIHLSPEAMSSGPIAKVRDGDVIRLDAVAGTLDVMQDEGWLTREPASAELESEHIGVGRELFSIFRAAVGNAERGASIFGGIKA